MASRDSQGLQIAVILLVIIVIALGVSCYFLASANTAAVAKAEAAETKSADESSKARGFLSERNELKVMLGYTDETAMDEITAGRDSDFKTFIIDENTPDELKVKNYRALLKNLQYAMIKSDEELALKDIEWKKVVAEKDAVEKSTQASLAKAQDEYSNLKTKYDALIAKADKDRNDLQKTQQTLLTKNAQIQSTVQDTVNKAKQEVASIQKDKDLQDNVIAGLQIKLKDREPKVGDLPDGKIVWVNQQDRKVWINLGSSDYLQPQMTFSVFEKGEPNIARAARKGSIEITQVLDSNQAVATITDFEVANPLMPGDEIFTPIWAPGRKMQFAMVGTMDLNGDGSDDSNQVRQAIETNGGKITAWVDENGNTKGNISTDTRYLILGDRPNEQSSPGMLAAYSTFLEDARKRGVDTLKVERFLDRTGLKSVDNLVTLSKTSRLQELENAAKRERDEAEFKRRRPGGSAYGN